MHETDLERVLDVPFTFKRRPVPLPGDMRPVWRLHVLVLLLEQCWGGKATHQQLHVLNWAIRTEETRAAFLQFVHGHRSPNQIIVRYDPSLNRSVDFAFAEGIATHHEEGPDLLGEESSRSRTYRIMLTKKGRDLLAVIRDMKECLVVEKEFLSAVGKKVTQQQVESVFTWSDGS
jgi:hypothetical protein